MFNFWKLFNKNKKEPISKQNSEKLAIQYALEAETERVQGHFENALNLINIAIQKECNNDMFFITQAKIYKDMKDYNNALIAIDKALSLNDKVQLTINLKNEIQKAIC